MTNKKSFAEIKAEFKRKQEEKQNKGGGAGSFNKDVYPFWNMEAGEMAVIRILPDANPDNPNPFPISREKLEHTLSINGKNRNFPSLEMWGEKDPIAEYCQKLYKAGQKDEGKKYWRKQTDVLRAIVIKDPLPVTAERPSAEGTKKTILFSFQLTEALNAAISGLGDDDGEPWDLKNGFNFEIKKTAQPGSVEGKKNFTYAIGSGFARKSTDVTALVEELGGLDDLNNFLPANPGHEKIQQALDAHLAGDDLAEDETPTGENKSETETESKPAATVKTKVNKPTEETVVSESDDTAEESEVDPDEAALIERIRQRRQAK